MRKTQSNENYWMGILCVCRHSFSVSILCEFELCKRNIECIQTMRIGVRVYVCVRARDKYEMNMIELLLNLNACT